VHAIQAVAAAWVAPAPGPKVRTAYEQILDARHALHEVTGRRLDRLVLEEQDEVARALGLLDGDVLLRMLAGAARTVAYAVDHAFRQADRLRGRKLRRRRAEPRPLADGVVEQDGEVCWPGRPTRAAIRRSSCAPRPPPRRPGCRWRRERWTG
jgi:[protein-PII] uridylyltransferase